MLFYIDINCDSIASYKYIFFLILIITPFKDKVSLSINKFIWGPSIVLILHLNKTKTSYLALFLLDKYKDISIKFANLYLNLLISWIFQNIDIMLIF